MLELVPKEVRKGSERGPEQKDLNSSELIDEFMERKLKSSLFKSSTKKHSKNATLFKSLTQSKQRNNVLLVVNGKVIYKDQSLVNVIKKFSKIEDKEGKEISIIPVARNKTSMVV